jgi:hypothetical protein
MAIKIDGTTVINDSQGLEQITSIDATTAASISAAGVGGGGTLDFTADGAISAGDVVVLNSDGTVSTVTETTVSASRSSFTSSHYPRGTFDYAYSSGAAYDENSGNVIVAYQNNGNTGYVTVGTVGSGNTITFGTSVSMGTVRGSPFIVSIGGGKFVISYLNSSYYGAARVATVTGTGVSLGTATTFASSSQSACPITYDEAADKVVIMHKNASGYTSASVGTVSGTTISFGSSTQIGTITWSTYNLCVYDPISQKIATTYEQTGTIYSIVGTVSGTSISYGSASSIGSAGQQITQGALNYDPTSQKIIFAYSDDSNSNYGVMKVGSISGTSLSFGTAVTWKSSSTNQITCVPTTTSGKIAVYGRGHFIGGTVSGTSVTFDSTLETFDYSGDGWFPGLTYDPVKDKCVIIAGWSSYWVNVYVFNIESVSSDNDSWIGVSTQAISDTASGSITVLGGVNDQQTGLTIGTTYYADTDGTLTATANDYKVGRATSTTNIFITEGNA